MDAITDDIKAGDAAKAELHAEAEQAVDAVADQAFTTPVAAGAAAEAATVVDPDGPGGEPALIPPVLEDTTAAAAVAGAGAGAGAGAMRRSRRLLFN